MKIQLSLRIPILLALFLSACGTNNNDLNGTAMRESQGDDPTYAANDPLNVTYTPAGDTGDWTGHNVNHFQNRGVHNTGTRDLNGTAPRNVDTNRNRNVSHNNNHNNEDTNRITVADRAAENIVAMREVEHANVLVTENTAYVAAQLSNNAGSRLAKDVEKRISDMVKSTDRDIDQVYVSINPDFYQRTTSYANDIRNGRPVAGFFDEFNILVRRIFPTVR